MILTEGQLKQVAAAAWEQRWHIAKDMNGGGRCNLNYTYSPNVVHPVTGSIVGESGMRLATCCSEFHLPCTRCSGLAGMTDYKEINALQRDLPRAKRLAEFLLAIPDMDWTRWEGTFLPSIVAQVDERLAAKRKDPLTIDQAQKLIELKDSTIWYEAPAGFSIKSLVNDSILARHLLDDDDVEFRSIIKPPAPKRCAAGKSSSFFGARGRPWLLSRNRAGTRPSSTWTQHRKTPATGNPATGATTHHSFRKLTN